MGKQPKVITVKVLVEPGNESFERTMGYVISALKSSLRNIRDGSAAVVIYNDEGEVIGMDVSGVPSASLKESVDQFVKKYEHPIPDVGPPLAG